MTYLLNFNTDVGGCYGNREWGVDWIYLVRDGYQWWALVHSVMKLRVP